MQQNNNNMPEIVAVFIGFTVLLLWMGYMMSGSSSRVTPMHKKNKHN